MSTRTLLTALLATALTMPVMAQPAATPTEQPAAAPAPAATPPAATPPAAAPAAVAVVAAPSATPAPAVSRDKDVLSVDFPDEDIKTILRNVADLFELNLVVPDTLTGKTSIKLRDVTWHQIFHVVLAPVGYTYVEEGNIIKIVSNENLQQEPVATEVFILNNAKAADIKPTIDGLIDAATGGKIVIDGRSNALVITERPSRMGRVRTIIDQLDKATDQVMIESKFVEVTDRDLRNIGVNWAGLNSMELAATNLQQTFSRNRGQDASNNVNTNNNTQGNTSNNTGTNTSAGNAVTYVSGPGPGVLIPSTTQLPSGTVTGLPASVPSFTTQANYTPATATSPATATALTTFNGQNVNTTAGTTADTTATLLNTLTSLTNTGGTARVASAVFSASNFNVIISALKTQNNTKIVSNPTVVTMNNTEAVLNVGQEFPIPNYTYNEQQGRFGVSGFTYRPIGIILKVTPQVNGRGIIRLNLEPEVSQTNGTTPFDQANIPIIATRKAKTQVSLKDGYTMGIGGLMTSSAQHGGTKVPVLGDIPLLGRLFSSKSVDDSATNLLIFITAKTISADGASPEQIFDPRAIEAVGMSREDLPGNRAPKGTDLFAPAPAPAK